MPRTLAQAVVAVSPDMKTFGPTLRRGTERQAGDAGKRAGKSFGDGLRGHLRGVVAGIGGMFAAAGAVRFFTSAISEAREAARVTRLTEQVIKSTGGAANVSAKQVANLADALSRKSGVDDEVIQNGANLLLTFTNVRNEVGRGNDVFNQGTAAALDMSAALGQDMKSSTILVGKALNDPIKGLTALRRVGVSFTQQQVEQIKAMVKSGDTMGAQKLILAELNKEFGGAAAAAADPAKKAQVAWANFKEELGARMLPVLNVLITRLTTLLPTILDTAGAIGRILLPAVRLLWESFVAVVNVISTVVRWFNEHRDVALALGIVIGALAAVTAIHTAILAVQSGALVKYIAQLTIVRIATAAWAAVQWVLNAALAANPIGIVIIAIVALVAAIVVAYRSSETFRDIVQATWRGIQAAAQFAWNNILKPIFDAWRFYMTNVVGPTVVWLWQNIVVPAFRAIRTEVSIAWAVISFVFNAIRSWIQNVVAPWVTWLWRNIFAPAMRGIALELSIAWKVISFVFNAIRFTIQNVVIPPLLFLWRNVVVPVWNGIRSTFMAGYVFIRDVVVNPLRNLIAVLLVGAFNTARNAITFIVGRIVSGVRVAFGRVGNSASQLWNHIVNIFASIGNGIVGGINALIKVLNSAIGAIDKILPGTMPRIDPIGGASVARPQPLGTFTGLAQGGRFRGQGGPEADANLAWLSNDEYVMRTKAARHYGYDTMDAINSMAFPRDLLAAYATGGRVSGWSAMWQWVHSRFPQTTLNSGFRPGDPGYHGRGQAIDIGAPGVRSGTGIARNVFYDIKSNFMKDIRELIWDFARGEAVWNGRNHFFTGPSAGPGTHNDHIHWAMAGGAAQSGQGGGGGLFGFIGDAAKKALGVALRPYGGLVNRLFGGDGLPHKAVRAILGKDTIKSKLEGWIDKLVGDSGGGAGGGQLGSWIAEGMRRTGVPGNWAGPLRTLIMRESGGNPNAQSFSSNGPLGYAIGLMQLLSSTFAQYRDKSLPADRRHPIANIVAGIKYIRGRYGSIFNVQQAVGPVNPGGYDKGGQLMPGWSTIFNGTGRPENVSTYDKMDEVVALLRELIEHLDRVGPAVGKEINGSGRALFHAARSM